jgi:Phosphatidylserine synthase
MGLLNRLTGADYLSLVALFFAWSSALLLLQRDIHLGVLAMAGAFCFDKLDGYYARSRGVSSSFGRQVDTFIDIFAYLVTGALLYHVALSPSAWLTLVVGFAILAFGGLRLVRHAEEGFGETDETSYYVGWTVVHVNFVVLAMFYIDLFILDISGWLAAVPIILSCPLMVSGYKSYKTTAGHALAGLVVVGALVSSVLTIAGVL